MPNIMTIEHTKDIVKAIDGALERLEQDGGYDAQIVKLNIAKSIAAEVLNDIGEPSKVDPIHNLDYTVENWELYEGVGAADVAANLNNAFMQAVNEGKSRDEVYKIMDELQEYHREHGAHDTEPRAVLQELLDKVFGEK